jgi:hypothetical protein
LRDANGMIFAFYPLAFFKTFSKVTP